MTQRFDPSELIALADATAEGVIDATTHARLSAILASSSEARRYYVRYMQMRADLVRMSGGAGSAPVGDDLDSESAWEQQGARNAVDSLSDAVELPAIRPDEIPDETGQESLPSPIYRGVPQTSGRRFSRRSLLLAASLLIAATVAGVLLLRGKGESPDLSHSRGTNPAHKTIPEVPSVASAPAVLGSSVGGVWNGTTIASGQRLPQGWLTLDAGLAEIQFDSGASVVVEGPARLRAQDNLLDLEWGRVAAVVPAAAHGFGVATDKCRVVDLGTEFGVEAQRGGKTAVAVFRGAVTVAPAKAPTRETKLIAGEAAQLSETTLTRDPAGAIPQRFVRTVSSSANSLDVVDLLAGGDGTGHRRGIVIDPLTGMSGSLKQMEHQQSDKLYHRVPALPVVDGVFIPIGKNTVSSAADTFTFPQTSGRTYYYLIVGGGQGTATMAGVNYAAAEHSALLTHANAGLTLDLNAIRRLHPGRLPVRFRSKFGNDDSKPKDTGKIDVFVLVDGQAKFTLRMDRLAQPITIDVPLTPADRFVTLAVTDGDDGISHDSMLWGDPIIELK